MNHDIYLYSDGTILVIPLGYDLFLAWVNRGTSYKPEWSLKDIRYLSNVKQAFGKDCTTFDWCRKSGCFSIVSFEKACLLTNTPESVLQGKIDEAMRNIDLSNEALNRTEW